MAERTGLTEPRLQRGLGQALSLLLFVDAALVAGEPVIWADLTSLVGISMNDVEEQIREWRTFGHWDDSRDAGRGEVIRGVHSILGLSNHPLWSSWGTELSAIGDDELRAVAELTGIEPVAEFPTPPEPPDDPDGHQVWLVANGPYFAYRDYVARLDRLRDALRVLHHIDGLNSELGPTRLYWWLPAEQDRELDVRRVALSGLSDLVARWRHSGVWPDVARVMGVRPELPIGVSMTESIAHGLPTPQGGFVIAQTADPAVLELRHGSVRVGSDLDQPAQASQSGPRDGSALCCTWKVRAAPGPRSSRRSNSCRASARAGGVRRTGAAARG